MSLDALSASPIQQHLFGCIENGESLDDLTDRLQRLFKNKCDQSLNSALEPKIQQWFESTIIDAIQAKQSYYANTAIGQISSFFQWVAKTIFGCAGSEYVTPLQHAFSFLQLVQRNDVIQYLNDCYSEDPPKNEFFHPSFLEVSLFCELHQPEMLEIAKSENSGVCLKVPGKPDTSFYVMPDGNCYLVSNTPENTIGHGAIKNIYRAYDLVNNKTVAYICSQDPDPDYPHISNPSLVKNEYKMLRCFSGVNGILQAKNSIIQNGKAAFFSDYYAEGSLFDFLGLNKDLGERPELTPKQQLHLMVKLLQGAKSIHDTGYLHRDLKDQNILIKKVQDPDSLDGVLYEPVIIDFDRCCKRDDKEARKHFASTAAFWPPEYAAVILKNDEALRKGETRFSDLVDVTDEKMDVWALGLVLYQIHKGKKPIWQGGMPQYSQIQMLSMIKNGKKNLDEFIMLDSENEIDQVIQKMLEVDPSKRITLADAFIQLSRIKV